MNNLLTGVLLSFVAVGPSVLTPETIEYQPPPIVEVITIQEETVTDALFEKIAYCESYDRVLGRNNLKAQNPNSTAGGEFQFLIGTWKGYAPRLWGDEWVNKDRFSTDNRELAWYVYTNYGTSDWEADPKSYNCWKGEIPNGTYRKSKTKARVKQPDLGWEEVQDALI